MNRHMYIVAALLAAAVVSDLRTYRISNAITYGLILSGLITNLAAGGMKGLVFSLQGLLLPVLCLLLLYMVKAIGAGDVKLLCGVGAVMGWRFVLQAMLFTFLCGGIMAALLILKRRNGLERFKQLLLYVRSCLLSMTVLEYSDLHQCSDGSKLHFSLAVAMGTVFAAAADKLGMALVSCI